jgi:hypothetical protein
MKDGRIDRPGAAIVQARCDLREKSQQGPVFPHLELSVERALQGARRCRRCAAVHGRYVCVPSAAVRNEWRHSDASLELIVHLLTCQPDGVLRLRAMLLVESEGQLHARAVYSCEVLTANLQNGPWPLNLISEKSDCEFVYPAQVEIVSSDEPPISREGPTWSAGRRSLLDP